MQFSNSVMVGQLNLIEIPVINEDIPVLLTTDVISFGIPLLLSKDSMK